MAQVAKISCRLTVIPLLLLLLAVSKPGYSIELGILSDSASNSEAKSQWEWAIRGSTLRFSSIRDRLEGIEAEPISLVVLEDECLAPQEFDFLESWVRMGGLLIVNGLSCRNEGGNAIIQKRRARLSGLSLEASDPGLHGLYPRLTVTTPLLTPFAAGDGIRFGKPGIARTSLLNATSASVLARGYRIEPGPGDWIRESDGITITSRSLNQGRVIFLNFSLAEITACYPDSQGAPTDCSGAGTARGLMRFLVANLLWEGRGQQIPLRWETPGSQALGVVLTGDVHADEEAYQVRSAQLMANRLASAETPVTYFFVGDVSEKYPEHFDAVKRSAGVILGPHSAHGKKYDPDGISGAKPVFEDIQKTQALLRIPSVGEGRKWKMGVRSHGWASDESTAKAWSAMNKAGVSVVFDHNADPVLSETSVSAPVEWFEGNVQRRLFLPVLERSVHTGVNDFVTSGALEGEIFSIGSPEPDPCCNWAVSFDRYTGYVRKWHEQFLKLGAFGGATEVWLWHPSTPVWKGGLESLETFVESLVADDRTELFSAHEFATWAYNREQVEVIPRWDSSGRLERLLTDLDAVSLAPLPPDAKEVSGTVSYWILGAANIEGWRARTSKDPMGRTLTVLSRLVLEKRQHQ